MRASIQYFSDFKNEVGLTKFQLLVEFYVAFSRFEYTLKAHRFLDVNAGPDWTGFAASIAVSFDTYVSRLNPEDDLANAIENIIQNPPQKQVVENNDLAWSKATPNDISTTSLLSIYIRRTRNNLFHGGKFTGSDNTTRNWQLIESALIVLSCWIDQYDLKDDFHDINI